MDSKYVAPIIISALNPYAGLGYLAYQNRDRINGWGQRIGDYGQGAINAVGGFLGGLGRYIRPQFGYGSQIGAGPTYGPVGPSAPMPVFNPNQTPSWQPAQPQPGRMPNSWRMPGVSDYRSQSVSSDRGLGLSQTMGSQVALLEYMAAQQNRPYQIER